MSLSDAPGHSHIPTIDLTGESTFYHEAFGRPDNVGVEDERDPAWEPEGDVEDEEELEEGGEVDELVDDDDGDDDLKQEMMPMPKKKRKKKRRSVERPKKIVLEDGDGDMPYSYDLDPVPSLEDLVELSQRKYSSEVTKADEPFICNAHARFWMETSSTLNIRGGSTVGKYGHIPSVPINTILDGRGEVKSRGLHNEFQAGIDGRKAGAAARAIVANSGAWVSGSRIVATYDDSEGDFGDVLYYRGQGASPQKCIRYNLALWLNHCLRIPIRVIRGMNLQSRFSPVKSRKVRLPYIYSGLYWVTAVFQENSTFLYKLVRLEGQPPLYVNPNFEPRSAKKKRRRTQANRRKTIQDIEDGTKSPLNRVQRRALYGVGSLPPLKEEEDLESSPSTKRRDETSRSRSRRKRRRKRRRKKKKRKKMKKVVKDEATDEVSGSQSSLPPPQKRRRLSQSQERKTIADLEAEEITKKVQSEIQRLDLKNRRKKCFIHSSTFGILKTPAYFEVVADLEGVDESIRRRVFTESLPVPPVSDASKALGAQLRADMKLRAAQRRDVLRFLQL